MLKLLLNPLARGAYFNELLEVAQAELKAHFPGCDGEVETCGTLTFLNVELPEEALPQLSRLSFVQGIFAVSEGGLHCLDVQPGFALPEDLVWGAKYRGKTHELVTQLAINLALKTHPQESTEGMRLLDPMAGRGTTLLWALRYGLDACGIEQDRGALQDLQRHVKRQTKLHRIKHKQSQGSVGKKRKDGVGQFLQYQFGERSLKLVTGDSRQATTFLNKRRYHLLVSDLPYGVQFTGRSGTRNPLSVLEECAPPWSDSLLPGGVMVLVFNALQPKREDLASLFVNQGMIRHDFEAPHRMSESIMRDLLVLQKPLLP